MNDLNPYEPPQIPSNSNVEPPTISPNTITLELKNYYSIAAVNYTGDTLFTFRRPASPLLDIFSAILAIVTFILCAFLFIMSFNTLHELLAPLDALFDNNFTPTIATCICIILPLWVAINAFYFIVYRFSFSTFAAAIPHPPLITIRYRFRGQHKKLDVLDHLNNKIGEIHSTIDGYHLKFTIEHPLTIIRLTQHKDYRYSLTAGSPHSDNPISLGEAQWHDRQLLYHSQLPSILPPDSKPLALNLLALAFINPANSHLFLR